MPKIVYKDFAPMAAEDASYSATGQTSFSNLDLNEDGSETKKITLEKNRWVFGSFVKFSGSVHLWSEALTDASGAFAVYPVLTILFDNNHSSLGVTLTFDTSTGEYCNDLHVAWYQGNTLKAENDFAPDRVTFFCEKRAVAWNKIVITFKGTSLPYHRLKVDKVMFGLLREFGTDEIVSASVVQDVDLLSAELPASQFDWTINSKNAVDYMFQLKQPVEVYADGLVGVYYINTSSRLTATQYSISAQDAIGVLGEQMFSGGAYLSGVSAKTLLTNIVNGAFPIDYSSVTDATLYGLLLPQTKREAIQQVVFAWGACVRTDGNTLKVFVPPSTGKTITKANTYIGSSVLTSAIVTQVNVTAHTYTQDSSGTIEVGGQKYSDTTTVYTVNNPNATANDIANIINVDSATLVSTANGSAIANRVMNHYNRRETHVSRVIYDGEKLGDFLTQHTPWNTTTDANITSINIQLSGITAAQIEALGVVD